MLRCVLGHALADLGARRRRGSARAAPGGESRMCLRSLPAHPRAAPVPPPALFQFANLFGAHGWVHRGWIALLHPGRAPDLQPFSLPRPSSARLGHPTLPASLRWQLAAPSRLRAACCPIAPLPRNSKHAFLPPAFPFSPLERGSRKDPPAHSAPHILGSPNHPRHA